MSSSITLLPTCKPISIPCPTCTADVGELCNNTYTTRQAGAHPTRKRMAHMITHVPTSDSFTDMELQWFHNTHTVVEVINLVTEDDIVGEGDFICHKCDTLVDVSDCRPCGSAGIHCLTCIEDYDLHVQ